MNKKKIRPHIITADTTHSVEEMFQNEVLRPVLKLQNQLLLHLFQQYLHKQKTPFARWTEAKQLEFIRQSIQRDQRFATLLLGTIIGHFTIEEWKIYQNHEADLRRRIRSLIIQRLQSQCAHFMTIKGQ